MDLERIKHIVRERYNAVGVGIGRVEAGVVEVIVLGSGGKGEEELDVDGVRLRVRFISTDMPQIYDLG